MVLHIYTGGLALFATQLAPTALSAVDYRTEQAVSGNQSKNSTHWAYVVAPGSASGIGQDADQDEHRHSSNKDRKTANPDLCGVKRITASFRAHPGQKVVAPLVNRGKQIVHNSSIGAVRCQKGYNGVDSCHHSGYEQCQETISKPFILLTV